MKRATKNRSSETLRESAEWVAQLEDERLDSQQAKEFLTWAMRSPEHIEEFLLTSALSRELDETCHGRTETLEELVEGIRSNVIDLEPLASDVEKNRSGSKWLLTTIASAAMIAALTFALFLKDTDPSTYYSTGVGQQMSFTLEDGSTVHLNTQSKLAVSMSSTFRSVELETGEAMFDVAKDSTRPFVVKAGSATFQAIGTQFNVYNRPQKATLTVLEGVVAVNSIVALSDNASIIDESMIFTAGQQADVDPIGDIERVENPDLNKQVAWRLRRLIFSNDSIQDVAREFNRYNDLQLKVSGGAGSVRKISGTFNANDPRSFVQFLSMNSDVGITESVGNVFIEIR